MEITRATEALKSTINTVVGDIEDILKSGDYYCTEEIARELNAIRNGLEHLRLDSTLLSSEEWQESFNPRDVAASLSGATSMLDRASARLYDYKSQLRAVPTGQKEENEVREMHQWAMTTLLQIQKDLEPYTYGASDRIRQFGDHVGVTDRYLGYRHNLTRPPGELTTLDTYWMDKGAKTGFMNPLPGAYSGGYGKERQAQRPELLTCGWGSVELDNIGSLGRQIRFSNDRAPMTIFRGYRTIDSLYPRSNTFTAPGVRAGGAPNPSEHMDNLRYMNSLNATLACQPSANGSQAAAAAAAASGREPSCGESSETCQKPGPGRDNMSVAERAGINTTFPGKTEYMQNYTPPTDTTRCSDFLINAKPDMQLHGRPLGHARYDPSFTEYHTRYEWPDGRKINIRPWAPVPGPGLVRANECCPGRAW